tara:strand:- start:2184 stop:2636 length:453 start_codon:yes stop_codon:yes gene_type:complete
VKYFPPSLLVISISLFLSGCGTTPNNQSESASKIAVVQTGLPPQKLSPGECGLFIWTTDTSRKFIGFETSSEGKLFLDGQILSVARVGNEGLDAEERRYELPGGQFATLSLEPGKSLKDGQSFAGQIVSKTSDGWDRVTPVVALSNCATQ